MKEYAYVFEKGNRSRSEDSILIEKMQTKKGEVVLAAVCDGMGGMDQGEIASGYIVEELGIWFYDELPQILEKRGLKGLEKSFGKKCYELHNSLKDYGVRRGLHLGSTMSVFLSVRDKGRVFHYGDSAVFRLSGRGKRLTKCHAKDGELTKCLGLGKFSYPDLNKFTIQERDSFLLCSDGLLHTFGEKDFYASFGNGKKNPSKTLTTMVQMAYKRGEKDNISAIYLGV